MKCKKCKYTHCLHSSTEITDDNFVKIGSACYHTDCAEHRAKVNELITFFKEQINPDVVVSELRRVINVIVFQRGTDIDYILWGTKEWASSLHYPQGLYYLVQDQRMREKWDKIQADKFLKEEKEKNMPIVEEEHTFTWTPEKEKSISNLFDD